MRTYVFMFIDLRRTIPRPSWKFSQLRIVANYLYLHSADLGDEGNSACRQSTQVLNPGRIKTSKFEYSTCIKSEISFFRILNSPKCYLSDVANTLSFFPSNCHYPDVSFSRKCQVPEMLFLRIVVPPTSIGSELIHNQNFKCVYLTTFLNLVDRFDRNLSVQLAGSRSHLVQNFFHYGTT